jgi:serine/threonine protein kinase
MMAASEDLEARLARFIEHHVVHGEQLAVEAICADRPELVPALRALTERYLALTTALDRDPLAEAPVPRERRDLPVFEGFETVERIGAGGMGEVYKLRDLTLGRTVAAKVIRAGGDATWPSRLEAFLREARALALFSDRRIVQIHEARVHATPPVLIMELVEGFELGTLAPSLDFAHRARILVEVCEAVHHAHGLGIQHRDLKPSNIMLDAKLTPRILDFGLSAGDPSRGHLVGTPPYLAPEQLDPSRPIDGPHRRLRARRHPLRGRVRQAAGRRGSPAANRDRPGGAGAAAGDRPHGHGAGSRPPLPVGARHGS